MSEDRDGAPVFLARNAWELGYIAEKSPEDKVLRHPGTLIAGSAPLRGASLFERLRRSSVRAPEVPLMMRHWSGALPALSLPLRHRLRDPSARSRASSSAFSPSSSASTSLRVLAKRRRRAADLRLAAGVQADRRDRHARLAAARMVDVDPEAARLEMGIASPPRAPSSPARTARAPRSAASAPRPWCARSSRRRRCRRSPPCASRVPRRARIFRVRRRGPGRSSIWHIDCQCRSAAVKIAT